MEKQSEVLKLKISLLAYSKACGAASQHLNKIGMEHDGVSMCYMVICQMLSVTYDNQKRNKSHENRDEIFMKLAEMMDLEELEKCKVIYEHSAMFLDQLVKHLKTKNN